MKGHIFPHSGLAPDENTSYSKILTDCIWYTMHIGTVVLFFVLMAIWLLMSGHYTVLVTGLGVVSVLFCTFMARRINADDEEGLPLFMLGRLPQYIIWLMREIIVSNIDTARIILFGQPDPVVFRVPASQKTAAGITTYANSITLTPGTVTMDIDDKGFIVHALTEEMADGVRSGDMDKRVSVVEGQTK